MGDLRIGNVVIGIPLAVLALKYLIVLLASEYEMELSIRPLSYLLSALLIAGVSLFVSFLISRKNRKIDMVEALKGQEGIGGHRRA